MREPADVAPEGLVELRVLDAGVDWNEVAELLTERLRAGAEEVGRGRRPTDRQ